jgi:hypothetical protein
MMDGVSVLLARPFFEAAESSIYEEGLWYGQSHDGARYSWPAITSFDLWYLEATCRSA